jgi:hypothetical protein
MGFEISPPGAATSAAVLLYDASAPVLVDAPMEMTPAQFPGKYLLLSSAELPVFRV